MHDEYRVAIYQRPGDPQAVRDVLVRELGIHPTDAMIHVHAAPGLLADKLPRDKAVAVAAAVSALGVQADAVPASQLFLFPHHDVVHHVECLEAGLEILEWHGAEVVLVPWGEVAVVSVGELPDGETRHWVAVPVTFAAPHHAHDSMQTVITNGLQVWIVARNPWRAWRIDHRQMNYEYLGPRMSLSATHNFRLFVEDLVQRAPGAHRTPSTIAYLLHGSPRELHFDSVDAFRHYSEFQTLIARRQMGDGQTAQTLPAI